MFVNNAQMLFPELSQVLLDAREYITAHMKDGVKEMSLFKEFMKKKRYWPDIQLKGMSNGLVLMCNTYNKKVAPEFQALYNQCRSVVVDLSAPEGQGIIMSMGSSIPTRVALAQYNRLREDREGDVYYTAMEGTAVYSYSYNDSWMFGTTSMPSIDSANFHTSDTFGSMFDEALVKGGLEDGREGLIRQLDPTKSYTFVLVHHRASKFMNYTELLGENYAAVYLISVRDRALLQEDPSLPVLTGVRLPETFVSSENLEDAIATGYGVIAKNRTDPEVMLIMRDEMRQREEECLGHPNEWYNMLYIYKKNNPEFRLKDYIDKYMQDWEAPIGPNGDPVNPVYIFNCVFQALQHILCKCYRNTTHYSIQNRTYKVLRKQDAELPGAIRFHLAQLRNLHVTYNPDAHMNQRVVYDYLCHHINIKDFRILVSAIVKASDDGSFIINDDIDYYALLPLSVEMKHRED